MDVSEFNKEKLVCTEMTQTDVKTYAYKYKYFGNAHGIVNMYVPQSVISVYIKCDDEVDCDTKLINSIISWNGSEQKKIVIAKCMPINFIRYSPKKVSIMIQSFAHHINTPEIIVECEYLRDDRMSNSMKNILTKSRSFENATTSTSSTSDKRQSRDLTKKSSGNISELNNRSQLSNIDSRSPSPPSYQQSDRFPPSSAIPITDSLSNKNGDENDEYSFSPSSVPLSNYDFGENLGSSPIEKSKDIIDYLRKVSTH